jgi:hypothetical protein
MRQTSILPVLVLTALLAACGDQADNADPSAHDGGASIEGVEAEPGIEATLEDGRIAVQLAPCPAGEVLKSTGDGYTCAADLEGDPLPECPEGDMLRSTGDGFECADALTSEGLPECPEGEILKSTGDGFECAQDEDEDTTHGTAEGGGLELADDELRLEACPAGQILKSTGDEYACADDEDGADDASYLPIEGGELEGELTVAGSVSVVDDTEAVVRLSAKPDIEYELSVDGTGLQLRQVRDIGGGAFSITPMMSIHDATQEMVFGAAGRLISRGNNSVQVDGALSVEAVNLTGNFNANDSTHVFFANSAGGSLTVTLPTASGRNGRVYTIKKVAAANTVTIASAGGTIDGAASINMTTQYDYRTVISNGTNWFVIGD